MNKELIGQMRSRFDADDHHVRGVTKLITQGKGGRCAEAEAHSMRSETAASS
jgi:hypothetical protein